MSTKEQSANAGNILLESNRLILRRPEAGDQSSLERVFCDPDMMHYLGEVWDTDKVTEVIQEWRGGWGVEHRWSGVLIKKDTQEVIGTAGLTENTLTDEAGFELSWFVLPEHQKQGFASEITDALLRFAFNDLGAERIVAETHPENPASNRVLKKLGFERLGECHHRYDDLPDFETQVVWALTRENWL
ncbi:MAG: GNAT family N-acetyltransferase [Chloroflexi bacterium]|nr:GNAT family N-acetyltransferase [Chloroflexota bacterium]